MSFGGLYFTNKGRALQAKSLTGVKLNFTRIAVGDGSLNGQDISELVDLINEVKTLSIVTLKTMPGGKATIGGILSNSELQTGFFWRELGIYANDPDQGEILYCYGNAGTLAEYIPAQGGANIVEKHINLNVIVGNAPNVTATIQSSLVYVTKQEYDAEVDIINQTFSDMIYPIAGGEATQLIIPMLSLVDGYAKTFRASANNNAAPTTINGKNVYKPGTQNPPKFIKDKAYTVWYDLAKDCFFFKASAEGDADSSHVLAGKKFSNDIDTGLDGGMTNNGAVTAMLANNKQEYTIPAGFHNGLGKIKAVITNLVAGVIKEGTTVGGIIGTFTADATALAADILSGKTAYVNGTKVTGSIPLRGNEEYAGWRRATVKQPSMQGRVHLKIPLGAYLTANNDQDGEHGVFADDPNFVSSNMLSGKSYFGLAGGIPLLNPSWGDQKEITNISVGRYSYNNGANYVYFNVPSSNYLNGVNWISHYEPDLLQENIVEKKTVCGIAGKATVASLGGYTMAIVNCKGIYSGETFVNTAGQTVPAYVYDLTGFNFTPRYIFCSSPSVAMVITENGVVYAKSSLGTIANTMNSNMIVTNGRIRIPSTGNDGTYTFYIFGQ